MASRILKNSFKRSALSLALGMCFAAPVVYAQSTTGGINGTVTAGEGTTVVISNNSGFNRTVSVDASGRYSFGSLPIGQYKVTAQRDGKAIGTRDVTVIVGRNADVSFGDTGTLEAVVVTGTNVAPIDITALDTRTVMTSEQIGRLPIARSAEAIALLAPGANKGSENFNNPGLVSFGGAGVSENAYYINGYFSGDPLANMGGFSMPFGSIDQQETYTGGYSARFGRSDGGVINQIGKSGTNEIRYGGQVVYAPKSLRSDPRDVYYPNLELPEGYEYTSDDLPGELFSRNSDDQRWTRTVSGYVGGPLIKDRLFGFVAVEQDWINTVTTPTANGAPVSTHFETRNPKIYAKVNWNVTDNHLVDLSYMKQDQEGSGSLYSYDFDAGTEGDVIENAAPSDTRTASEFVIAKYTGYLTDTLTFNATYGQGRFKNETKPYGIPGVPLLAGVVNQNPAITGGTPITNNVRARLGRDARNYTDGLRADLEWMVGDHVLTAGIDDLTTEAENEGQTPLARLWTYGRATGNLAASLGVGSAVSASNPNGYYVREGVFSTATSMTLEQKAWFLEDRWQVNDNVLLSLGIRNDEFINKNDRGVAYMDEKDQWAPRIGASWDVFGDSTLKVYANAGRYFLAMPNDVAIRGASSSINTQEYFTYTGIDQNGNPTGLTAVPRLDGATPRPVSSNGELGQPIDVLGFAPNDLKNMYQDEYLLGFDKAISNDWAFGAKFTYRDLKSAIDDVCNSARLIEKLEAEGHDHHLLDIQGCYMFNPGGSNTFSIANLDEHGDPTGSRTEVVMTAEDWGLTEGAKRTYKAIDVYLEHPFDGKWEGRLDYTYSKLQGNTEGQVKSEFGQENISKTQDWDAAEIMAFANGYLYNDRRHQLKIRGSYLIAPEWTVGGNLTVTSGAPISCLGYYNPDGTIDEGSAEGDPIGYGASYHTCFGDVATPGELRTPWVRSVDLGLTYRPAKFDNKLALNMQVFNVFNDRETTQVDVTSEDDAYTVSNTYLMMTSQATPRYWMLSASVDF